MILVTGGAGFIGSNLVHRLVRDGHEVLVLDDFSRGKFNRLPKDAGVADGDIRDVQLVSECVRDCDQIVHLAYVQGTQTFYEKPSLIVDVALKGIVNVLDACARHGGRDVVLVSSSEAYATPAREFFPTSENVPLTVPDITNPRFSYGGGKIACELAVMAYAHDEVLRRGVIVRPHNVYGPDMGFEHVIPQMAMRMLGLETDEFEIQGSGQESRCFCHVDDAVDGLVRVIERGENRNVYHLGTEWETRMVDLAHQIARVYERTIRVVASELPAGSPPRRLPDISKLRGLGYDPRVTLDRGLAGTLDWYRVQWWDRALA